MITDTPLIDATTWPFWKKCLFRFFCIYLFFFIAPWNWFSIVPHMPDLSKYYYQLLYWAEDEADRRLFHIAKTVYLPDGRLDNTYGFAQIEVLFFGMSAFIGSIIWSIIDWRRRNYQQANYWLCIFARYFISYCAFGYGFLKLLALQMPFPNASQLSTPLGDLSPMRLSWLFIGYSPPYQIFSGVLEVIVGLLLLNKRTSTLGVIFATGVFLNILMLNLSYDINVKIFSMQLLLVSLFLLANEFNRVVCFFILDKPASACKLYQFTYTSKWMRFSRIVLKSLFIVLLVGSQFYRNLDYYQETVNNQKEKKPFKSGVYDVATFVKNKDTLPPLITDTMRWKDFILDKDQSGSINTRDTIFYPRYNRRYFSYSADTISHQLKFQRFRNQAVDLFSMRYEMPDDSTIRLWGKQKNDSLFVELKRSNRHFQLIENQFHWLSASNR